MSPCLLGLALCLTGPIGLQPILADDSVGNASSTFERSEEGARIYETYCFQCHGTGWAGAPRANDRAEWSERVAAGVAEMLKNSKQGLNGMPPMGSCAVCSDEQLRAAIAEMLQFE